MKNLVIFAILAIGAPSCAGYKFNPDSLPEEIAEFGIKTQTGQDVDLSIGTPESSFSPKSLYPVEKEANTPSEK